MGGARGATEQRWWRYSWLQTWPITLIGGACHHRESNLRSSLLLRVIIDLSRICLPSVHTPTPSLALFGLIKAENLRVVNLSPVKPMAVNFSGGGFSNYYERPPYQDAVVSAYLDTIGSANAGLYNRCGRGYPDISAQAKNLQVVIDRVVVPLEGTSCSSPTAVGVISLLNDHLISKQRRPLGLLNPLIYSKAYTGFNDITSVSNPGCNSTGFTATEGWDPVRTAF
ncbi:peptidase S8/S53 domain-containing protein [Russula dissimulans]|nr:peptidase S8/S53 domain-containing protein [Russula dissimulans]